MNLSSHNDSIVAIATPSGPSARGIIRVSGPAAFVIAAQGFAGFDEGTLPRRAEARSGLLRVRGLRNRVPASCIFWPGSRTYTGEPLAEIHTIGAPPILEAIVEDCLARGARLAEPGEFTLRAFLSGRIDLTRSEAVLGIIDAETPSQLHTALAQLAGGVERPLETLRERLLNVLAHLEANLDFAEEPDVDLLGRATLVEELRHSSETLNRLADQLQARTRFERFPRVVLIGPPNAGKSRLFNALTRQDRSLVSPLAGTTRDYLAARILCEEIEVELIDTAGLDLTEMEIEVQAQQLARDQAKAADLLLVCECEADSHVPDMPGIESGVPSLRVYTKYDLGRKRSIEGIRTSALTGEGLELLKGEIARHMRDRNSEGGAVASTSLRCRESLMRAGDALQSAAQTLGDDAGDELVAVDLYQALDALGRVVGRVVSDDVLDRIFSRFCIGK